MEGIKILSASNKCLCYCSLTHHDLTKRLTKRLTHATYSPFFKKPTISTRKTSDNNYRCFCTYRWWQRFRRPILWILMISGIVVFVRFTIAFSCHETFFKCEWGNFCLFGFLKQEETLHGTWSWLISNPRRGILALFLPTSLLSHSHSQK